MISSIEYAFFLSCLTGQNQSQEKEATGGRERYLSHMEKEMRPIKFDIFL